MLMKLETILDPEVIFDCVCLTTKFSVFIYLTTVKGPSKQHLHFWNLKVKCFAV